MGKTYRNQTWDDESRNKRAKNSGHSNNKRTGGMKVVNSFWTEDDDDFDDGVYFKDEIVINKISDDKSTE